ncbi:MAG: hypothetical protein HQK89_01165 [Nitrospirae bacterium]|nr:hypothetical protein [Nitrospirota bacterium]
MSDINKVESNGGVSDGVHTGYVQYYSLPLKKALNIVIIIICIYLLSLFLSFAGSTINDVNPFVIHYFVEIFITVISMLIFSVGWNSYTRDRHSNLIYISCAFLTAGLMNAGYLLSFAMMPDLPVTKTPDNVLLFRLASKFISAFALFTTAVLPWRPFKFYGTRYYLILFSLSLTVVLYYISLFSHDMFPFYPINDGESRIFEIRTEVLLLVLSLLTATIYLTRFRNPQTFDVGSLFTASVVMGLSTLYVIFYPRQDVLHDLSGHILYLVACIFIYHAIFVDSVREPYERLKRSESALREGEEKLLKYQQMLMQSEKLAALGILSAGISHELKNPLAIIIQGTEYLESSVLEKQFLKIIDMIKKAAIRADNIIKGLLNYSRQMPFNMEDANISDIIDDTLLFLNYNLNSKSISIIKRFPENLPVVKVDANQMQQAVLNILINSIEATPRGGSIEIDIGVVGGVNEDRSIEIAFKDHGHGISDGAIQKVFDPFFSTKQKVGGTGLGLSITHGIISSHNGKISIESLEGKGTRVVISLPCQ